MSIFRLDFGVPCGFQSMTDLGLWKQAWMWVLSQKHILAWAHTAACGSRERLAFLVDRHWPAVSLACATSSRLALAALRQWRGCMARGVLAVASLGPAAVFVILWSFFVCMTSPACALYALLSLVRARQILLVLSCCLCTVAQIYWIRILGDGF